MRRVSTAARRPRVVPGRVSPPRAVPATIARPSYVARGGMSTPPPWIPILTADQQQRLRAACALAKAVREFAQPLCQAGATTDDIDRLVHEEIVRSGAYPSPLGYGGFPKSLCASVNDVVVHGIPDSRPLVTGDLVNIDVSVFYDGFHGDTSQTFLVGDVDDRGRHLVDVTTRALLGAIAHCCRPQQRFRSIGAFVHDMADAERLGVVQEFTGHGIGEEFHCLPYVLHHRNDERGTMRPGMAFTVEPALTEGSPEVRVAVRMRRGRG